MGFVRVETETADTAKTSPVSISWLALSEISISVSRDTTCVTQHLEKKKLRFRTNCCSKVLIKVSLYYIIWRTTAYTCI